jgi:segregation and condensation protein B
MEPKDNLKYIIESLLFVSDSPIMLKQIHFIMPDVPMSHIRKAVEALALEYNERGGSFYLSNVAGGIQLRTRPIYKDWIKRFIRSRPMRLSRAALEALAIVAYKQPVTRAEVDKIRGVDSGAIMKSLVENKLIRIIGRKEVAGRPMIYTTSRRFLEVFDLNDLKDLPTPDDLEIDEADAMNTVETNVDKPVLTDEKQEADVEEAAQTVDNDESDDTFDSDVINNDKLDSDIISNDKIDSDIIINDKLDSDIISNDKIDSDIIINGKLDSDIISNDKLDSDIISNDNLDNDGSGIDNNERDEPIDENGKHGNSVENDTPTDINESADASIETNAPSDIDNVTDGRDEAENPMIDDDSFEDDAYDDSLEMPINLKKVRGS